MQAPTRHQIIFLNGPPKSGKDTAVRFILKEWLNVRHRKFASPLKAACAGLFGIEGELLKELEAEGSPIKNEPRPELFGHTWREALIWLSEKCMKPHYGKDVFGQLMANELLKPTPSRFTVISDAGFPDEAMPVMKRFGIQNCHLFRIYREGYTFNGDSRNYWFENDLPNDLHIEDIHNEYELSMFRIQVLRRVDKIMGREMVYDG